MSLITRCPACETLFKVVPDQLRISEGWVRCGQCDEIFDASLHLLPTPPTDELPDAPDVTPQPVAVDLNSGHLASPDEWPVEQALVAAVPSLPLGLREASTDDVPAALLEAAWPRHEVRADLDDPEVDRRAELRDVSFLHDKRNSSVWRKPHRRATLILLSLALLLGLSGQLVFQERDRIVAWAPSLKPWLLTFCSALNCTLSPLRRIDAIVIDSSSFSKINADFYRLNFTVKNTAVTALAVPAIELTLTDTLDQPVVRRVFIPAELGGHSDALAAGAEWLASLTMAVKAEDTPDRVAGYRLLAFYP